MKKRLEAELISIAHRVLKLKNKSEVDKLYLETQKLYEALTILKFYGDNYEQVKSEISNEDIEDKIEIFVENKTIVETANVVVEETIVEETQNDLENIEENGISPLDKQEEEVEEKIDINNEIIIDENNDEVKEDIEAANVVSDEITNEDANSSIKTKDNSEPTTEIFTAINDIDQDKPKMATKQISFEELLGQNYVEPVFVKPSDQSTYGLKKEENDDKTLSLNDRLSKSINIGFNDRIGFVKHLFAESTEDYNRVLSQLNTFGTYKEAKDFIDNIIKPDYNNWIGKDDYEARFIEIVEKKFL